MSTKTPEVERKHALLSASGASRWLACTPSARLEDTFPETTSVYAEEGTLAHSISELKVKKAFVEPMSTRKFNSEMKKLEAHELYQAEMQSYTDLYLDYITELVYGNPIKSHVAIETKLDYSAYAPEGFGTADCVIICGDTLRVIDFKYGKGVPVSPENNPQMMLYGLGAYLKYSFLYDINTVELHVAQPRLDNMASWSISIDDLLLWAEHVVKPTALLAFKGEGVFVPGDHCRFCRASSQCRKRAEYNLALDGFDKVKPPLITNDELGEILQKAQNLTSWIKDLEEYALKAILAGEQVKGWKVVEGRSNRQITNIDLAFNKLKDNGYEEEMLYERKPITLTAIEKLVGGKKPFTELLSEFVIKPPGKPTLALEGDKRKPYQDSSIEAEFGK